MLALSDGQRLVREPEITLDLERLVHQTVSRAGGAYSGRIAATFARNSDAEPNQPARSASVTAGIVGVFANNSRTPGANASKLDTPDAR